MRALDFEGECQSGVSNVHGGRGSGDGGGCEGTAAKACFFGVSDFCCGGSRREPAGGAAGRAGDGASEAAVRGCRAETGDACGRDAQEERDEGFVGSRLACVTVCLAKGMIKAAEA